MTADAAETIDAISISTVIGGRTADGSRWFDAIRELRREVIAAREGVVSPINIDVEFHIPGPILAPEFEGVRTGSFRRRDSLLKVQAALPPRAPQEPRSALLEMLSAGIDAAEKWAAQRRQETDLTALRRLVAELGSSQQG